MSGHYMALPCCKTYRPKAIGQLIAAFYLPKVRALRLPQWRKRLTGEGEDLSDIQLAERKEKQIGQSMPNLNQNLNHP